MIDISPDIVRRIRNALSERGVREVRIKIEDGQVVVLAVRVKKVE